MKEWKEQLEEKKVQHLAHEEVSTYAVIATICTYDTVLLYHNVFEVESILTSLLGVYRIKDFLLRPDPDIRRSIIRLSE